MYYFYWVKKIFVKTTSICFRDCCVSSMHTPLGISLSMNKHTRNAWICSRLVNYHQLKIHNFCPAFPFSCILEDLSHLKRWLFVLFLSEYGPTNRDIWILFHTVFLTKFPVTCEKDGSLKSCTAFFNIFPPISSMVYLPTFGVEFVWSVRECYGPHFTQADPARPSGCNR